jgi:acyl-CoA synthetase (AMP-forming)/AMP-acid ligase II
VPQLVAFAREHLPGFKVPKLIDIISSVPRTSLGKPNKAALRNTEWKGTTKKVH